MPVVPTTPISTAPVDLKSALSSVFDGLVIPAGAGCSVSINRQGQVLLERGRGQVAPGRAADADSLYRIGSLTKPFTAAALLISEKAGRLNRNDKVSEFRAYPEPAPTIDQLIKHVPGLTPYANHPAHPSLRTSPTTVDTILSMIPAWDGVQRNEYSNSHAAYTGAVLEKVNGLRYEDIVQRDIFGPLGMSRSSFTMPAKLDSVGFPFPSDTHPTWGYAAGGITSTAPDMTRFFQALLNNQFGFGDVESFDRSTGITSFAMFSSTSGGELSFVHGGIMDSYQSYAAIYPADRSSVVIACNSLYPNSGLATFASNVRNVMLTVK